MIAAQTTADLFDDGDGGSGKPAALNVTVSQVLAGNKALGKPQQAFQRLVQKIETKRAALAQWQAYAERHQQRLAGEYRPLALKLLAEQRLMVLFLDQVLQGKTPGRSLGKVQRAKAVDLLLTLLDQLLADAEDGRDAELEAIHDRHADFTYAEIQQDELARAEAMLTDVFGMELDADHGATTAEELLAHGQRKLQERAAAEAHAAQEKQAARADKRRRANPAAAAKAAAAEALREQATQEVSQSLREVFRKLASALHPDREPDAVERQRKTALMQRVNQAYQANDLLALLGLQLEIEQIDAKHLADVPPQRLAHYSQILREQLQELDAELAQCVAPFQQAFGWQWRANTRPEEVNQVLSKDLAQLQLAAQHLREDREAMQDPKMLRQFLAEYEIAPDFDDDDDDIYPFAYR
ncbi:J domain-containing protein [Roseateles sp. GG27B]